MGDLLPSRSRRAYYIWHVGVRWFGALWGAGLLLSDIWRGRWPRAPIGFTWAFAVDVALELLVLTALSVLAGVVFGYLMWHFARWFMDVQD